MTEGCSMVGASVFLSLCRSDQQRSLIGRGRRGLHNRPRPIWSRQNKNALWQSPQAFTKVESDVLRTLDTTYGSAAFIWHLTPIIPVSLTRLTRTYCRSSNHNALIKRKARAKLRGPLTRQARRQARNTKRGRSFPAWSRSRTTLDARLARP